MTLTPDQKKEILETVEKLRSVKATAKRLGYASTTTVWRLAKAARIELTAKGEAARERITRLNADPEFAAANAERSRERMTRLHADPEFAAANAERGRERMTRLHADPEFRTAAGERMTRLNADPEFEARRIEAIRAAAARRRAAKNGGDPSNG